MKEDLVNKVLIRTIFSACDDGRIRIWEVKEPSGDGPTSAIAMESSNEPALMLQVAGSTDRVTIVQFHPLAKDVVASASADLVIRVWNLSSGAVTFQLDPHPDQVY